MRVLYTIGIWFYTLGIRLAALFRHSKARQMVEGWKHWPEAVAKLDRSRPVAWFHAASLGEFEQARPVLEAYRNEHPESQVLVTFFSPSGYEVRKNYPLAEAICYLPMDLPGNVRRLLDATNPTVVFFVKYEFWFNYLSALHKQGITTYIFSTIFRPNQYFFKWYGGWFRKQLRTCFAHLFVQNNESIELLKSIEIDHCTLAGDTRFDRVHQIAEAAERNEVVETFLSGYDGQVLVGGSTWPPDEQVIANARKANGEWFPGRIILAPHVINEEHLQAIKKLFPDSIRYSKVQEPSSHLETSHVLIIDNIGLLSKIYRYANIAYIGGGFGVGIHNILEAVTFGKPVFFGPNYHKFQEAHDIIARGGGWSIDSESCLEEGAMKRLMSDPEYYRQAAKACKDYMQQNLGSTEKILSVIRKQL